MGETYVPLTPGSGVDAAVFQDSQSPSRFHQEVIVQTQAGGADPVSVSATNPLPIAFQTAQPIVGNVAAGTTDSGAGVKIAGVANSSAPTYTAGQRGDLQLDLAGNLKLVGNVAAATTDSGAGIKVSAVYNSTLPTYTNGQRGDLQVDANGRLIATAFLSSAGAPIQPALDASGNILVNIAAGAAAGGTSSNFTAAFPGVGTALGVKAASGGSMTNLQVDASNNLNVNVAAGALTAVTDNSNVFTAGTSQGLPLAFVYNDAATAAISGDFALARITVNRQVRAVTDASVNGGCTPFSALSGASTNATLVKNAPGQVYAMIAGNVNANPRYVKFYNSSTIPTAGAGTPIWRVMLPGNTSGAGAVIPIPPGLTFSAGIGFTITGGAPDNDTTIIAANDVTLNLAYL